MTCNLCKWVEKDWKGDDRRCAFPGGHPTSRLSSDNWNCATMNQARDFAKKSPSGSLTCSDGQSLFVLPLQDGEWLMMSWYKTRGRTDACFIFDGDGVIDINLSSLRAALPGAFDELDNAVPK